MSITNCLGAGCVDHKTLMSHVPLIKDPSARCCANRSHGNGRDARVGRGAYCAAGDWKSLIHQESVNRSSCSYTKLTDKRLGVTGGHSSGMEDRNAGKICGSDPRYIAVLWAVSVYTRDGSIERRWRGIQQNEAGTRRRPDRKRHGIVVPRFDLRRLESRRCLNLSPGVGR